MKAEIISIGTELLLGEITDTNAAYLAGQLPVLGLDLYWISQVGDNKTRIVEILQRAWQRSDVILTTGGLGPTDDDITRESLAAMLGEELSVATDLEKEIRDIFNQRGIDMPTSNIKQATIIPSAVAIHNVRGTAPGWWIEKDSHIIIAMPGPPREMQRMWQKEILPKLQQRYSQDTLVSKTFKTFGLGEAGLGEMVSPLLLANNPTLGIYAKSDGVHLRLAAKAPRKEQAELMLAEGELKIRSILNDYIWGTDNDTLETLVGNVLIEKKKSLAVMESSSGGYLTNIITDVPGNKAYFRGSILALDDNVKANYDVVTKDNGINVETTRAMARAVRLHLGADIGLATSDITGSTTKSKLPVGTAYIAIDDGKDTVTIKGNYPGDSIRVKRLITTGALVELKKYLNALD